ncbi:hypothetical protein BD289DRAFT_423690 [Coniella lustricola]|uniref:Uncharacterized protein n=1 Tax=Coniella lustricola TaxID=2025994 RepID=A0A2T3AJE4_9PEZI|nr:hypothetical protein BD289DRAFT_423690 [Coniella lustricola]
MSLREEVSCILQLLGQCILGTRVLGYLGTWSDQQSYTMPGSHHTVTNHPSPPTHINTFHLSSNRNLHSIAHKMYLMEEILRHWRLLAPSAPRIDLDNSGGGTTNPQSVSPLFSMLPRDIRFEIYAAFWQQHILPSPSSSETASNERNIVSNPRLGQHIKCSTPDDGLKGMHFVRFPCVLRHDEFDGLDKDSESDNDGYGESWAPDAADYDDPGDVGAAYLDLEVRMQQTGSLVDGRSSRSGNKKQRESPWCGHDACMAMYLKWKTQAAAATTATSQAGSCSNNSSPMGLLAPLLLCKETYREAAPLLYSATRFLFENEDAARRFVAVVPRGLRHFVRHVDILATVEYVQLETPEQDKNPEQTLEEPLETQEQEQTSELLGLCRLLGRGFPHLRDLRITLHVSHSSDPQNQAQQLPPTEEPFYKPLYALAKRLDERLRQLDVKMPVQAPVASTSSSYDPSSFEQLGRGKVRFEVVPPGRHHVWRSDEHKLHGACPTRVVREPKG